MGNSPYGGFSAGLLFFLDDGRIEKAMTLRQPTNTNALTASRPARSADAPHRRQRANSLSCQDLHRSFPSGARSSASLNRSFEGLKHANERLVHANAGLVHANESPVHANEGLVHANESLVHANEGLVRGNAGRVIQNPRQRQKSVRQGRGLYLVRGGYHGLYAKTRRGLS